MPKQEAIGAPTGACNDFIKGALLLPAAGQNRLSLRGILKVNARPVLEGAGPQFSEIADEKKLIIPHYCAMFPLLFQVTSH